MRQFLAQKTFQQQLKQYQAARAIQGTYRKFVQEPRNATLTQAAIIIQTFCRGYLVRRAKAAQHVAAVSIQAVWRRYTNEIQFTVQLMDIISVQSRMRGWLVREKASKWRSAAGSIQLSARKWLATQRLATLRKARDHSICLSHAATLCQSLIRRKRSVIRFRSEFALFQAARTIQKSYRMHAKLVCFLKARLAAIWIQALCRAHLVRRDIESQRIKATKVQAIWRKVRAERQCLQRLIHIVMLQSLARKVLATKFSGKRLLAVLKVQCAARSYLEHQQLAALQQASRQVTGAILFQSIVRRNIAMVQYRIQLDQFKAARSIQSSYRMHTKRYGFLIMQQAVIQIQNLRRGHIVRNMIKANKTAAVVIQSAWRRYSAEFQYASFLVHLVSAQSAVRRHIAAKKHSRRQSALEMIHCAIRQYLAVKKRAVLQNEREYSYRLLDATVVCQSSLRRNTAARKYRLRLAHHKAAQAVVRIQNLCRGHMVRSMIKANKTAAITIQSSWRRHLTEFHYTSFLVNLVSAQSVVRRRIAAKRGSRRQSALRTIQCAIRRYSVVKKRTVLEMEKEYSDRLVAATVVCQSSLRRTIAARIYSLKLAQYQAARVIQTTYRAYEGKSGYCDVRMATIAIQSTYRMYLVRCENISLHVATTTVQTTWRRFRARQWYSFLLSDIVIVQSCMRRFVAILNTSQRKIAVVRLQCAARVWVASQQMAFLYCRTAAATSCQSFVRRNIAMTRFQSQLAELRSAKMIQTRYRSHKHQSRFFDFRRATIWIQASYRARMARRQISSQKSAAIVIQTSWRKFYTELQYLYALMDIAIVQRFVRCKLATKRTTERLLAVRKLQCAARTHLARKTLDKLQDAKHYLSCQIDAATLCQSMVRRNITRCMFNTVSAQFRAAKSMQSCYRTHRQQCAYSAIRKAAIQIQSFFRGRMVRNEIVVQSNAAIFIQTSWRRVCGEINFSYQLANIVSVQCRTRQRIAMKHCLQRRLAVEKLQCMARRWWAMQQMVARLKSEEVMHRRVAAVTKCQSMARRNIAMSRYQIELVLSQAAVAIQSFHRMHRQQCYFSRTREAAILIQSSFRAHIVRCRAKKQRKSVITIQTTWRRCWTEEQYSYALMDISTVQNIARRWLAKRYVDECQMAIISIQSLARKYLASCYLTKLKKEQNYLIRLEASATFCQVSFWRIHFVPINLTFYWAPHK